MVGRVGKSDSEERKPQINADERRLSWSSDKTAIQSACICVHLRFHYITSFNHAGAIGFPFTPFAFPSVTNCRIALLKLGRSSGHRAVTMFPSTTHSSS